MDAVLRRIAAMVIAVVTLAACSQTSDNVGRSLVAPGGFDFYDCPQLARREADLIDKERTYLRLMDKAKQDGAGGRFVSAIAYESDYASNVATLRELRKAQKERNCTATAPTPVRRSDAVLR